jgi:hypothetical protein
VVPPAPEDPLHDWARQHVKRVRKLKLNVGAYVIGMAVLTAIWVMTQWADNGAFERLDFSPEGAPGAWEPWIIYPGLIWGFFLGLDALKVLFDRPTTEDEVERQVRRVQSRDAS